LRGDFPIQLTKNLLKFELYIGLHVSDRVDQSLISTNKQNFERLDFRCTQSSCPVFIARKCNCVDCVGCVGFYVDLVRLSRGFSIQPREKPIDHLCTYVGIDGLFRAFKNCEVERKTQYTMPFRQSSRLFLAESSRKMSSNSPELNPLLTHDTDMQKRAIKHSIASRVSIIAIIIVQMRTYELYL
jgi:hypothetical protein